MQCYLRLLWHSLHQEFCLTWQKEKKDKLAFDFFLLVNYILQQNILYVFKLTKGFGNSFTEVYFFYCLLKLCTSWLHERLYMEIFILLTWKYKHEPHPDYCTWLTGVDMLSDSNMLLFMQPRGRLDLNHAELLCLWAVMEACCICCVVSFCVLGPLTRFGSVSVSSKLLSRLPNHVQHFIFTNWFHSISSHLTLVWNHFWTNSRWGMFLLLTRGCKFWMGADWLICIALGQLEYFLFKNHQCAFQHMHWVSFSLNCHLCIISICCGLSLAF